ncbi:nucleoside triphosphate pyrophosphohydrolase [Pseudodesulfovibrio sp.]|uniref:nucleoside triphosphate pyrophosphohydrolase n=1 Tax=unclassified Pseudodesulfovibrio TaxID=2661612 RepID=UPI003B00ADA9
MSGKNRDGYPAALLNIFDVIDALLGPNGCPWDQEQTPTSMCDYLAEETFEMIEAIRTGNTHEAMEELGDTLFILLFIATRYEQQGAFNLADALDYSATKMVRRHPHVFGNKQFKDREALYDNWEATKREENKDTDRKGVFDSLPSGLPPLLKAYRINSKAARNHFTWPTDEAVESQLTDEWQEWKEALASKDDKASEEEFGDYLFTLVELGRRKGIKANGALDFANQKFLRRFRRMEELAEMRCLKLHEMELDALNKLWEDVKSMEE